jgi:predicted transglutaminase-like cysteine proteinase
MIIRISAAVLALMWVHGFEATKQDVAEMTVAAKTSTPGAAIRFCIDNEALCKGTLETASVNLMAAQMIEPAAPAVASRADAALPRVTTAFPLPPRRPVR